MTGTTVAQLALEGAAVGAAVSFTPGPALLSLVDLSLARGRIAALWFAAGLFMSDLALALASHASIGRCLADPRVRQPIALAGAALLLAMGVAALRPMPSSSAERPEGRALPHATPAALAGRGALLNLLNPFVLAFWLSAASATAARRSPFGWALLVACAAGTLTGDVVKVFASDALRARLSPATTRFMRRVSGIGLVIFAARAAWLALFSAPP